MLSVAPLTRKGCAMATKEIDGLLQFKDKNGDVNIVYPVTKAENVEGLFGENGKIPSDQLPDMDYLPLAGGTMAGSINMSSQAITNLKDPVSDGDAVNKKHVDSTIKSAIPTGVIVMWSGSTSDVPTGWALCNGENGTPDLRNRFVVGAGASYSVGARGGADTIALGIEQMPRHTHSFESSNAKVYIYTSRGSYGSGGSYDEDLTSSSYGASSGEYAGYVDLSDASIGSKGSGQPIENRPPYYALCYIMKV